jgi:NTE family protein
MRPGDPISRGRLQPTVALALGGGGARGLAHLGVLKVLEEEEIPIHLVVGSSMGALVAALWTFSGSAEAAERKIREVVASPNYQRNAFRRFASMAPSQGGEEGAAAEVRRTWALALFFAVNAVKPSYFDPQGFSKGISELLPDRRIEDSPLPIALVATDLVRGSSVTLTEGPVRTAVLASSALAGVFPPVNLDGKQLVDGGYTDVVPVEPAFRLGADAVLAVDVSDDASDTRDFTRTGNSIHYRSMAVLAESQKRLLLRFADGVIHPDVSGCHWTDFEALDEIVPRGEAAARAALPAIRGVLKNARWKRALGLVRKRRWSVDLRGPGT